MELKEYFRVIKQRWWIPMITVICCLALAFVYNAFYVKPVYQASADLIVNQPAETDAGQQLVDQNSINTNLMLINTYRQIITSEAITKYVVQNHPELGMTAEELSSKITINTVKDTQVITLIAKDSSYDKAAKIVNAVSHVFIDRVSAIMNVNNVSVLNEADMASSASPVNDHATVLYLFSAVVGLVLGYGIIFLISYLDDSIRSEYEIEHELGLTLLGQIRKARKRDFTRKDWNEPVENKQLDAAPLRTLSNPERT